MNLGYYFNLPSLISCDLKKTLVNIQIYHRSENSIEALEIEPFSDSVLDLAHYLFNTTRMGQIMRGFDHLLQNEIKIVYFSDYLKKSLLHKLIEAGICPKNSVFDEGYFMFCNFETTVIKNSRFEQHFVATLVLKSQNYLISESENLDSSEMMIIKVEP